MEDVAEWEPSCVKVQHTTPSSKRQATGYTGNTELWLQMLQTFAKSEQENLGLEK